MTDEDSMDQLELEDDAEEPEDEEEASDALQEPGPAALDVRERTSYGETVGEGNAERYFPARTREEAEASLEAIAAYCHACPERDFCPEAECAVYRAEATALARIGGGAGAGRESVMGVILPSVP